MTQAERNNAFKYAFLALAAFAVGCTTALIPQLMDPSMPVLNWRIVIGAGLSAFITAYGASFLPRRGATGIATQVDALRDQGVHRDDMVVVPRDQSVVAIAEDGSVQGAFTSAQLAQVLDGLETRMRAEPAALDDPLPPSPRYPGHG